MSRLKLPGPVWLRGDDCYNSGHAHPPSDTDPADQRYRATTGSSFMVDDHFVCPDGRDIGDPGRSCGRVCEAAYGEMAQEEDDSGDAQ